MSVYYPDFEHERFLAQSYSHPRQLSLKEGHRKITYNKLVILIIPTLVTLDVAESKLNAARVLAFEKKVINVIGQGKTQIANLG